MRAVDSAVFGRASLPGEGEISIALGEACSRVAGRRSTLFDHDCLDTVLGWLDSRGGAVLGAFVQEADEGGSRHWMES